MTTRQGNLNDQEYITLLEAEIKMIREKKSGGNAMIDISKFYGKFYLNLKGTTVILEPDEVLKLRDELGSTCAKIIQERADSSCTGPMCPICLLPTRCFGKIIESKYCTRCGWIGERD